MTTTCQKAFILAPWISCRVSFYSTTLNPRVFVAVFVFNVRPTAYTRVHAVCVGGWGWGGGLEVKLYVVSLSKNINPSLVLVQPRKTRPFITERLLMGCKESNQTNKQAKVKL